MGMALWLESELVYICLGNWLVLLYTNSSAAVPNSALAPLAPPPKKLELWTIFSYIPVTAELAVELLLNTFVPTRLVTGGETSTNFLHDVIVTMMKIKTIPLK